MIMTFLYLSFICTVESADTTIKCYKGVAGNVGGNKQEILSEETCETGVTQCLKYSSGLGINADKGEVSAYNYGCSDKTAKAIGCVKEEKNIAGLVTQKTEKCVCNGNLCNSASTKGVNFIMAFLCFVIPYLRFYA